MLEKLIDQLGHELAMREMITSSKAHHYLLPFDGDIEVEVIEQDHGYLLKGLIGVCPQHNSEAFLLQVMEANLFGQGTRGGVIGLTAQGNLLTLSLQLDYNSTYKDFKERLEDFVSVIDFWRKEALKHH